MASAWDDLDLRAAGRSGSGEHCYRATISAPWQLVAVPQGGVLAAVADRAMRCTFAEPAQRLRTLSGTFAGQVAVGPVDFRNVEPGWLLGHSHARWAGDGYASVEMTLWDAALTEPVAYATQVMFFAFGR